MLDPKKNKSLFLNREISWLSFNERVLQEAKDPSVPLMERFKYLGIFSNNLDEFFKVRVANIKRMANLNKRETQSFQDDPKLVLSTIQNIVLKQTKNFESIFQGLRKEAEKYNIKFIDEKQIDDIQLLEVKKYFEENVRPALVPLMLDEKRSLPHLRDKSIYLAVKLIMKGKKTKPNYSLIEVPADAVSRFLVLQGKKGAANIILLDDIIRANLFDIYNIFNIDKIEAYTIKFTRDAELDIDDDISKSLISIISKSVKGRKQGNPVRFVYDQEIPQDLLDFVLKKMGIKQDEHVIPGGRYHNFKDFMNLPQVGHSALYFEPLPPLPHPYIKKGTKTLDQIKKKDILINYPYQTFNYIVDLLREAAIDPDVTTIKINIYRLAKNSKIVNTLINAVKNGKNVIVVLELRARFDEENNINWANQLKDAGVKIIFGVPGLKVHSKLILITRREHGKLVNYSHIGTGNFNGITATYYGDISLLTADNRIANEVSKVFDFFENNYKAKRYAHLIVSPYTTRRKFVELINNEIKNVKAGKPAYILLKLNNLVDDEMIKKLYEASEEGVKIDLIIRGICSLIPQKKGLSENINAYSIVDRFLEHARVMYFLSGGEEKVFISSADWMTRNLDKRVEVSVPIYNKELKNTLKDLLDIQLKDNTKLRIIDEKHSNIHKKDNLPTFRSQLEIYHYFQNQIEKVI
jgi:polyphosphate kinase